MIGLPGSGAPGEPGILLQTTSTSPPSSTAPSSYSSTLLFRHLESNDTGNHFAGDVPFPETSRTLPVEHNLDLSTSTLLLQSHSDKDSNALLHYVNQFTTSSTTRQSSQLFVCGTDVTNSFTSPLTDSPPSIERHSSLLVVSDLGTSDSVNTSATDTTASGHSSLLVVPDSNRAHPFLLNIVGHVVPLSFAGIPDFRVTVRIGQQTSSYSALIDTGADLSAMTHKFATANQITVTPTNAAAIGPDGHPLEVMGYATTLISFPSAQPKTSDRFPVTAIVVRSLTCDFIIGRSFLYSANATISFPDMSLIIGTTRTTIVPISSTIGLPSSESSIYSVQGRSDDISPLHCNNIKVGQPATDAAPTSSTPDPSFGPVLWDDVQRKYISDYCTKASLSCPKLLSLLLQFRNLFKPEKLGTITGLEYHVELTQNSTPVKCHDRRWPAEKLPKLRAAITDMIDRGWIQPTKSPWAHRIVPVNKPDGSLRVCIDFRPVNTVTIADAYPSANPDDILDRLSGRQFFTKLDAEKGYYQIKMAHISRRLTAFTCPLGLFEFVVLPFGLKNAVAFFQRFMNELLGDTLFTFTEVLLDDILVNSFTYEDHLSHLLNVFQRLRDSNVTLNLYKCEFAAKRLLYLGHIIDRLGLHPDPKKVIAIANWAPPKTKKEVLSFNGAVNYLRRFIPNCSKFTGPLADLTSDAITTKDITKHWTQTHKACFEYLKAALVNAPVLAYPDFNRPFQIETDASDTCIGGVLTQEKSDESHQRTVLRPVAYYSAKLNPAQCHYDAPTREALAIVMCLEHFRHYLNLNPVKIITDHAAHQTLTTRKDAHDRLDRWRYRLSEFTYTIEYRAGCLNHLPDALSRLETTPVMETIPHDPDAHPVSIGTITTPYTDERRAQWITAQKEDPMLAPLLAHITDPWSIPPSNHRRWLLAQAGTFEIRFGLLHKILVSHIDGSDTTLCPVVVPESLKHSVLDSLHDSLPDGIHLGIKLIYPKLRQYFWWKNMFTDLEQHISSCTTCQRFRQGARTHLPLQSSYCPTGIMDAVAIDAIRLPEVNGFCYALVAIDLYTGYAWALPVKDIRMDTVYKTYDSFIFSKAGYPKILISDGGPEFNNEMIVSLCQYAATKHHICAPYNPQGNSYPERFNRTLIATLATTADALRKDPAAVQWPDRIHNVVDAFNRSAAPQSTHSRFFLFYGREPRLVAFDQLGLPQLESTISDDTATKQWVTALELHSETIQRRRATARDKANETRPDAPTYNPGRLVWLADLIVQDPNNRTAINKLEPKWIGPFVIVRALETSVTWIVRPLGGTEQFTRNGKHIKKYVPPRGEPDNLPSHQVIHDEASPEPKRNLRNRYRPKLSGTQFVVERVLEHRWTTGSLFFFIRWQGFSEEHDSWEPELNLSCPDKIRDYFSSAKQMRPPPRDARGARRPE